MMKLALYLCVLGFSFNSWSQPLWLSRQVYETSREPFISHKGEGVFSNYLSLEVPFQPVKQLFDQIRRKTGTHFQTRGEAHITVITPIEYDKKLKQSRVTMNEIEAISLRNSIQSSSFRIHCLGSGSAIKNSKRAIAYYLVVSSNNLIRIREEVARLARAKDPRSTFNARDFYPHITVGFINDDVHESDGLFKDVKTCVAPIKII